MFGKEPTVIIGAISEVVRQFIPVLIIFGVLHWTDQQIAQVMILIGVVVKSLEVVLTRSQVVPVETANKQIAVAVNQPVGTRVDQVIALAKEVE